MLAISYADLCKLYRKRVMSNIVLDDIQKVEREYPILIQPDSMYREHDGTIFVEISLNGGRESRWIRIPDKFAKNMLKTVDRPFGDVLHLVSYHGRAAVERLEKGESFEDRSGDSRGIQGAGVENGRG